MASKYKIGQNGLLIDPSNERVVGALDRNGNELLFPYILAQSAVPIILLPAGVWNNNSGQLAVGTALPYLPSGVVWVYLAASGIAQAGLYQATFSGTAGAPVAQIVGNPVTTPGAYTPSLAEVTLATATVPGGSMGAGGSLRSEMLLGYSNSANNKTVNIKLASSQFGGNAYTTSASAGARYGIRNRGPARQVCAFNNGTSDWIQPRSGVAQQFTVDTTVDQGLSITGQLANAADFIILEGYTIEVLPGA